MTYIKHDEYVDNALSLLSAGDVWYVDIETFAKDVPHPVVPVNPWAVKYQVVCEKYKELLRLGKKGKLVQGVKKRIVDYHTKLNIRAGTDAEKVFKAYYKAFSKLAVNPFTNHIRLIQIGTDDCDFMFDVTCLEADSITAILSVMRDKLIVGQNLKFDLKTIACKYGLEYLPTRCFDTYLVALLDHHASSPEKPKKGDLKLESIVSQYLGYEIDKTCQMSDWSIPQLSPEQLEYARNDIIVLRDLYKVMGDKGTLPAYRLENRFLPEMIRLELAGIPVDKEFMMEEGTRISIEASGIKNLYQDTHNTNISSPDQLLVFFNSHDVACTATNATALASHKENAFVQEIQKSKQLKKKSDLLFKMGNDIVFPNYKQIEAQSGRMSGYEPNMQQIPRDIKDKTYKAPDGWKIGFADYPAIELRIASVIANDPTMIQIFIDGMDPHRATASLMSGVPLASIVKDERQKAKPVNFGLVYGMMARTLKEYALTGYGVLMTLEEAEEIRNKYFLAYPKVAEWHLKVLKQVRYHKSITVQTLLGRVATTDRFTKGLNIPVQGSGADIIKLATIRCNSRIAKYKLNAKIINLVHDEIVFLVKENEAEMGGYVVKEAMEYAVNSLIKPFKTEVDITFQ